MIFTSRILHQLCKKKDFPKQQIELTIQPSVQTPSARMFNTFCNLSQSNICELIPSVQLPLFCIAGDQRVKELSWSSSSCMGRGTLVQVLLCGGRDPPFLVQVLLSKGNEGYLGLGDPPPSPCPRQAESAAGRYRVVMSLGGCLVLPTFVQFKLIELREILNCCMETE